MASVLLNFGARERPAARVLARLHGFCADCTIKNHECLHYRHIRICFFIRHGSLAECLRERLLCYRKGLRRRYAHGPRQRTSRRKVQAGGRFLRDPVLPFSPRAVTTKIVRSYVPSRIGAEAGNGRRECAASTRRRRTRPLAVAYKMLEIRLSRAAKSILGSAPNRRFSSNFASLTDERSQ
jgi:hypothetical protein